MAKKNFLIGCHMATMNIGGINHTHFMFANNKLSASQLNFYLQQI